jgi:hypothetical protein
MTGKKILAFLLMKKRTFDWSLGSENKFRPKKIYVCLLSHVKKI